MVGRARGRLAESSSRSEEGREDRAHLLAWNEPAILDLAARAGADDVILIADASDGWGAQIAKAIMGESQAGAFIRENADRNEIPTVIMAVERRRLLAMVTSNCR